MEQKLLENIRSFPTSEESRAYAWVDCNRAFKNKKLSIDELSKELFIFLASWGMLRGKAFLSAYNWRILRKVTEILKEEKYEKLYNPEIDVIKENLDKIMELYKRIDEALRPYHTDYEEKAVSSILVTKILLGSLGCSVAYDTNVTVALEESKIAEAKFSKESLISLCNFYAQNKALEEERQRIKKEHNIDYPPMKILDMAFWPAKD
ncbi:MAG: hypothetical protein IJP61_03540 [Treponema sp.]|nr:hypothetical protein [Treponema sp.]MBR0031342.1 hypothetical protein [Treponema sp.]